VSRRRGRTAEIDTIEEFDQLVAAGARTMLGWRLQGIDLTDRGHQLRRMHPAGSLFLGVTLHDDDARWLREHGALVLPRIPELPFDPYRAELYTPDDLYAGIMQNRYAGTVDAEIYAWSRQHGRDPTRALSRALHDQSIDAALDRVLADTRCVGVMGGHTVERGSSGYHLAAELGRALTRAGLLVMTGGGPGAMEAANLGAYVADASDDAVEDACGMLSTAPGFRPSITEWARAAFDVRTRWPRGPVSLGIPTWFYGHEPTNAFASQIAKYFRNAIREDTLLSRSDAGIVFLPGAAGTVQEIFQDACENYYADDSTVAPMILHGAGHWRRVVPAWPLLKQLASGRPMEANIHLTDTIDEVVSILDRA
jgi:predicted Rossmann-fold nucleotide-binding protein